jgi:hypothetical protein
MEHLGIEYSFVIIVFTASAKEIFSNKYIIHDYL